MAPFSTRREGKDDDDRPDICKIHFPCSFMFHLVVVVVVGELKGPNYSPGVTVLQVFLNKTLSQSSCPKGVEMGSVG